MQTQQMWDYGKSFNSLPLIEDVEPFSEADRDCLAEIKEVLSRHNALTRFGIALLHKHYDLGEGEVLVESTDVPARTQITAPLPIVSLEGSSVTPTIIALGDEGATLGCYVVCVQAHDGSGHFRSHIQQGS